VTDVVGFDSTFQEHQRGLNTWDLWGAAYVINGGCSDDDFTDFRSWVVSQGRDTYLRAYADPDSLVEVLPGRGWLRHLLRQPVSLGAEDYAYAAGEVYESRTENKIYEADEYSNLSEVDSREPSGEPFDEDADALRQRYPRLAALFGT
jgi:Protein of unknown function (DUF4240)